MVKVHKLSADFNIVEIRESFMRQFSTPQLDLVMDTEENSDENQSFVKKTQISLTRSPVFGARSGGHVEKQLGISSVIRFVSLALIGRYMSLEHSCLSLYCKQSLT